MTALCYLPNISCPRALKTIMNQEEFSELIRKYQFGELDPGQKAILDQWFESLGSNGESWTAYELEALRKKIMVEIGIQEKHRRHHRTRLRVWLPYAAALLLVCLGGLYYFDATFEPAKNQPTTNNDPVVDDAHHILPGGNKAMLTLADGRTITLSGNHTGIIVSDKIAYEDGTSLLDSETEDEDEANIDYYQLTTPRGGQYSMTLPDGSRIWLNASSTLKYPSRFAGNRREVELIGEAYFEIKKQTNHSGSVSFIVKTANQEIEVLGTQFNVAAYTDEMETRTTLVEGAVTVRRSINDIPETGAGTQLRPGEESVLTASGIQTRKANLTSSIAWKSGIFVFDNTPFDQMMKQIARWYDIDVVYKDEVPKELFEGKMSRNVNLQVLINFLRDSGIDLRVKERTVYIGD